MSFASKTEKKSDPDRIASWSFSRWGAYEECPKKAYFKFIKRIQEPSSPVLERGTAMHKLCEDYLRDPKKRIPAKVAKIAESLKDYRARGAIPEAEFAFNKEWKSVDWFARDAWCRVKADVTIAPILDAEVPTVEIHDFKTGGEKKLKSGDFEDYYTQLELYALSGLLTYPTAERAVASLVFIDHGDVIVHPEVFARKDVDKLKKKWETRTKRMLADTVFKPKPGNACRWCHFRKSNSDNGGGQCVF